jgi:hypothetical protein
MRNSSRRPRAFSFVFFALALITGLVAREPQAHAQVNAEALRSNLRKNPKFLWIEGALVGRAGNTQTTTFAGALFSGITSEPHLFFARLSADYGEARGTRNVSRWLAHARYNYRVNWLLALEALAQAQHDRFRRIGVRDLYGAGPRFAIVTREDFEIFSGTTYLLEHEVITADIPNAAAGTPPAVESNKIWNRSSTYAGLNVKIAPIVDASTVTYFQPRFDKPSDFRLLSDSFIAVTITKMLSARVSGSVWYDNDPPAGVKTYDVEVKNSLVLKFD